MTSLSVESRHHVAFCYFAGLSYDQPVEQTGVSKGSVVNIANEIRKGVFPETTGLGDQVEALRDLAVILGKHRLNPNQVAAGLAAFAQLQALGIEPTETFEAVSLYRTFAKGREDPQVFARCALVTGNLMQETGRSAQELETWLNRLREEAAQLEPVTEKVELLRIDRQNMLAEVESLREEVPLLEHQRDPLKSDISRLERRDRKSSRGRRAGPLCHGGGRRGGLGARGRDSHIDRPADSGRRQGWRTQDIDAAGCGVRPPHGAGGHCRRGDRAGRDGGRADAQHASGLCGD